MSPETVNPWFTLSKEQLVEAVLNLRPRDRGIDLGLVQAAVKLTFGEEDQADTQQQLLEHLKSLAPRRRGSVRRIRSKR